MRRLIVIILTPLLLLTLFLVTTAQAQSGDSGFPTDNDVNAIAKKLYCPVCPNTPLDVCETQACKDWREEIKGQLAAGWSEEQILDYFVEQYGERVLAEPQRRGFTSLVWVLPILATILAAYILMRILKSWRASRNPPAPPDIIEEVIAPEKIAAIEKEVRELL